MVKRSLPLKGIKAVDFSWMVAGPLMGAWLGSWGATVVRVESHTRMDFTRLSAPSKDDQPGMDRSAYFANLNCCKYSVTLDLNKPKGRELALKLIQWSDIVIESFSVGQMKKWGLEYDEIAKTRPDIIYLSTNQLGQTGPYAGFAGFGHHATALSGITEISGWPDRDPAPPRGVYIDHVAPPFGEALIMAALDRRARTSEGAHIDLAQVEAAMQFISPVVMDYVVNGHVNSRQGNRLPSAAPHGVYPCTGNDRWIAIGVFTDDEWHALCNAMENPDLTKDSKFNTLQSRKENEDELEQILAQWTSTHTAEDLESLLQSADIAAHVVSTCGGLLEDPQLAHRGYFQKLDGHPAIDTQSYESPPYKLSKGTTDLYRAPCLGEHNSYVFHDILGLSDDEIASLLIERVITTEADLPSGYM